MGHPPHYPTSKPRAIMSIPPSDAVIPETVEDEILREVRNLRHAMYGSANESGLYERIRNVERVVAKLDTLGKWLMMGVGGVLLSVALQIVQWYFETKAQ